jgi:hypothetical protein
MSKSTYRKEAGVATAGSRVTRRQLLMGAAAYAVLPPFAFSTPSAAQFFDAHAAGNAAYEQAFTKDYREVIDPLPWDLVQDSVRNAYASTRLRTRAVVIGGVSAAQERSIGLLSPTHRLE